MYVDNKLKKIHWLRHKMRFDIAIIYQHLRYYIQNTHPHKKQLGLI